MSYALTQLTGFLIRKPSFHFMESGGEAALMHVECRKVLLGSQGRKTVPVRHRVLVEAPNLVRNVIRPYCRDGTWVQLHGSLEYEDRRCKCDELIRIAQIVIAPGVAGGDVRLLRLPPEAGGDGPPVADRPPAGAVEGPEGPKGAGAEAGTEAQPEARTEDGTPEGPPGDAP